MFPTRHWRALVGTLAAGERSPVAHGLMDGRNGSSITPDVLVPILESPTAFGAHNLNIVPYQTWDTTNVYLSNYDSTIFHVYHLLVRSYWSGDDTNQ
jgi:hypothetical protein